MSSDGLARSFLFWYSWAILYVAFSSDVETNLKDINQLVFLIPVMVIIEVVSIIKDGKLTVNDKQNLIFDGMSLVLYGSALYLMDDYGRKLQFCGSSVFLIIFIISFFIETKFS